jgi:hypothetical protein
MDNFDLRKYLAEGRLLKENVDFPELEDEFEGAMDAMVVEPKVYFQGIIDASAEEIISDDYYEIMNAVEQGFYSEDEAVKLAKAWAKEKLSNLSEGKLYEAINLDIEDDIAILSGDSGEYEGEIEDGKVSFSVIYDDLDYRISDQYDENNIEDFLGKGHAFVELAKKYDHKWGIERDLVGIIIKLK